MEIDERTSSIEPAGVCCELRETTVRFAFWLSTGYSCSRPVDVFTFMSIPSSVLLARAISLCNTFQPGPEHPGGRFP